MKTNLFVFLAVSLGVCTNSEAAQSSLKDAFKDCFLVGAALNESEYSERAAAKVELIKQHFNTITPENVMKWALIHPRPDRFDFTGSDRYVEFGEKHSMFIIGHTLIWHRQTPRWVFEDEQGGPADRDTLLARMSNHITSVVGRYKGRVKGWDVVNEALNEDGSLRPTPWLKIIGEDYLLKAFQFAHAADPDAELYYNDFSLENAPKRDGAIALIRKLRSAGAKITALGTQEHNKLDWPSPKLLDDALTAFSQLGIKVMVTELDVDVLPDAGVDPDAAPGRRMEVRPGSNPYTAGLPDSVQQALAHRYAELFKVYVKHRDLITRVTFWGVTDADSWLNNWPARGRTSHPLLFDRQNQPKPAFEAVLKTAPKSD